MNSGNLKSEIPNPKSVASHARQAKAKPAPLVRVSDHAIVRFLERVQGINIEEIKLLIRAGVEPYLGTVGNGNYPLENNCVAIVRDGHVLTVRPRK